jgi:hypothetical protein
LKVLKCGAGEGWRKSAGQDLGKKQEIKKRYIQTSRRK